MSAESDHSKFHFHDDELIEGFLEDSLDEQGLTALYQRLVDPTFSQKLKATLEIHGCMMEWSCPGPSSQEIIKIVKHSSTTYVDQDDDFNQRVMENIRALAQENTGTYEAPHVARMQPTRHAHLSQRQKVPTYRVTDSHLGKWLTLLGCLLFGLFIWYQSQPDQPEFVNSEILPSIVGIKGQAVNEDGKAYPLRTVLSPGDQLYTRMNSEVILRYPDNTNLRLGAQSHVKLYSQQASGKKNKKLYLASGKLWANVSKQEAGSQVYIRTPHATATVLGTAFSIQVHKEYSKLQVDEGKVSFARPVDSANYVVEAGYKSLLGDGIKEMQRIVEVEEAMEPQQEIEQLVQVDEEVEKEALIGRIVSYTLINVDTGLPIAGFDPIPDQATIYLSKLPTTKFTVRINTEGVVPGLNVIVNGEKPQGLTSDGKIVHKSHQKNPPYSIVGDVLHKTGVKYYSWVISPGAYQIETQISPQRGLAVGEKSHLTIYIKD